MTLAHSKAYHRVSRDNLQGNVLRNSSARARRVLWIKRPERSASASALLQGIVYGARLLRRHAKERVSTENAATVALAKKNLVSYCAKWSHQVQGHSFEPGRGQAHL